MDDRLFDRREFLFRSLAAALTTTGLFLVACDGYGGGGGAGPGDDTPCTNGKTGVVGGAHTHSIEKVCQEDAGTAVQ
ncbi:MAG TPA: hypothetical protein VLA56_05430, partial [Pseudomonadales bacterium]|nr:hypothetical protein [Pseudomonadales bacterium]